MIPLANHANTNAAPASRGIHSQGPSDAVDGHVAVGDEAAGQVADGAPSESEAAARASDSSADSPMSMWLAALRRDARARVVEDMLAYWKDSGDISFPDHNFREDPEGTYIYDAARDEVLWQPSSEAWPKHSIDVMKFPLHDTGNTNSDDSERTFEDEVDYMDSGWINWFNDVIDCDAIIDFINELAESQPAALERPAAIDLAQLAIFCDGADEEIAAVGFEAKARWFEDQFKAGAISLTPMMVAATAGQEEMLAPLLGLSHAGAIDIGAVDAKGLTAADHAAASGHSNLAERIRAEALAMHQRSALEQATRIGIGVGVGGDQAPVAGGGKAPPGPSRSRSL